MKTKNPLSPTQALCSYNHVFQNNETENTQQQQEWHSTILKSILSISSIPLSKYHQLDLDASEHIISQHKESSHKESQHIVSQHREFALNLSSKTKTSFLTSFTFVNSTNFIPPAPHLATITELPDSDIAQLWDLVRVTVAQRSRQATSTMSSHEDNPNSHFKHNLPNITPSEIVVSPVPNVTDELRNLQLGDEFCGETFYGCHMNKQQAEKFADDMKYIKPSQLMFKFENIFFGENLDVATGNALDYVEQQRETDTVTAIPTIDRRHTISHPTPSSSAENQTIFTPATPIQSFPSDKDPKRSPRLFYLRLQGHSSSLEQPGKQSSTKGSTHEGRSAPGGRSAVGKGSTHGGGSSRGGSTHGGSTQGNEKSNTRTLSFGLDFESTFFTTRFFEEPKIPKSRRTILSPFLDEKKPYADFLRVVFLDGHPQYQAAREEMASHAEQALCQLFSTPRVNSEKENKSKSLHETVYFEFICYDRTVEVWKMKYDPRSQTSGQTSKSNSNNQSNQASSDGRKKNTHTPTPKQQPSSPSFHLCSLGVFNLTEATNVRLLSEFVYTVLRWGLAKHCPNHAFNLHQLSWREGHEEKPQSKSKAKTLPQMNAYWSS